MVSCVFVRQVWFTIMQSFGLQILAPQIGDNIFVDWWVAVNNRVSGQQEKKGLIPSLFWELGQFGSIVVFFMVVLLA